MLLNTGAPRSRANSDVDPIHNYYETVVLEEIAKVSERARQDPEYYADVACVALNHLPPRYIRHDVDMSFFLSPQEQQEIQVKVEKSVADALSYVTQRNSRVEADAETNAEEN